MHKKLINQGNDFYSKMTVNESVDALEFRTWLASSIEWLHRRVSDSELHGEVEAIKIFQTKPNEIEIDKLEKFLAILTAQGNKVDEMKRSVESMK